MKNKFLCIFALLLILCLTLCACTEGGNYGAYDSGKIDYEGYAQDTYNGESTSENATTANSQINTGRKVIISEDYTFETTDLDKCVSDLEAMISGSDCYLETSNVSGNTADGGWLTYTIRVPVDKLEGFTKNLAGLGNLTSKKRSSEDVTLNYYDNESKLASYKIHQERLLALLEKAQSIDEILRIETELATVRANIENLTTAQNKYDNLVAYSTVVVHVTQVKVYSEPESEGFFAQLGDNFVNSFSTAGEVLKGLLFLFVWFLPYILMACVIALIIILIVKHSTKKKSKKNKVQNEK